MSLTSLAANSSAKVVINDPFIVLASAYFKKLLFLSSPNNVIDTVQSEGN